MTKSKYHVEVITNFNAYGQEVYALNEVSALVLALEILNIQDYPLSDNFAVSVTIKRKGPAPTLE